MYRLEDLNLGDKVTLDGGETGIVACIMTDDYKDELDVFGNIVIRACVCPHGMNPYLSVEIDSIVKVEKSMENLIRNLISALNGEAYEEAKAITDQIIATGDEELIKQAEYINSVL